MTNDIAYYRSQAAYHQKLAYQRPLIDAAAVHRELADTYQAMADFMSNYALGLHHEDPVFEHGHAV